MQRNCKHKFCFKKTSEEITYMLKTDHKQKLLWKIKTLEWNYFIFHLIQLFCIRADLFFTLLEI